MKKNKTVREIIESHPKAGENPQVYVNGILMHPVLDLGVEVKPEYLVEIKYESDLTHVKGAVDAAIMEIGKDLERDLYSPVAMALKGLEEFDADPPPIESPKESLHDPEFMENLKNT